MGWRHAVILVSSILAFKTVSAGIITFSESPEGYARFTLSEDLNFTVTNRYDHQAFGIILEDAFTSDQEQNWDSVGRYKEQTEEVAYVYDGTAYTETSLRELGIYDSYMAADANDLVLLWQLVNNPDLDTTFTVDGGAYESRTELAALPDSASCQVFAFSGGSFELCSTGQTVSLSIVPEPATSLMTVLGAAALIAFRRHRQLTA